MDNAMESRFVPDQSICRITPLRLEALDGVPIGATLFEPAGPAVGTVIVHGATATPAGYYRRFAEFLAGSGLRVVTYDYRGIGGSRPPTLVGYRATMSDWANQDARAVHRFVRHRFGKDRVAVVGHSFGGQLLGLVDEGRDAAGIVLVGSQLGYYGHWPLPARVRLGIVWYALVPVLTSAFGYLPGKAGLGEDLPSGVAEEWGRWCRHPDYFVGEHPDAEDRFAQIGSPVLLYSVTDDDMAPEPAVDALMQHLRSANVEHRRVDPQEHGGAPIGHFGFFRPRFRTTLWRDAATFLTDALQGRTPRRQERGGAFGIRDEDIFLDLAAGRA
jgi:predicted alpha/beta hydrolase